MNKYENRVVLFLDILGFKSIVDKTVDKEMDVSEKIQELYNIMNVMTDDFTALDSTLPPSPSATQVLFQKQLDKSLV